MKIKYTKGLDYLVNFIQSYDPKEVLELYDVYIEAVNNKLYTDFFINFKILEYLVDHRNKHRKPI